MDEQVDLAKGAGAFRLSNPPPWLACLNMASLEVSADLDQGLVTTLLAPDL